MSAGTKEAETTPRRIEVLRAMAEHHHSPAQREWARRYLGYYESHLAAGLSQAAALEAARQDVFADTYGSRPQPRGAVHAGA